MDYEALGKYTHAIDRAQTLHMQFTQKLKQLTEALKTSESVSSGFGHHVPDFNAQSLRERLEELASLHVQLLELGQEANIHAERCGKTKVTTGRGANRKPI